MIRRMWAFIRPPQPTKPTLIRSLAPMTRLLAGSVWRAWAGAGTIAADAATAPTCLMNSRRVVSGVDMWRLP